MLIVGLPLSPRMKGSGSYYGATTISHITEDDIEQARELERRIVKISQRLSR
jgi:NAD(P)H dehydrogenase (quinone)